MTMRRLLFLISACWVFIFNVKSLHCSEMQAVQEPPAEYNSTVDRIKNKLKGSIPNSIITLPKNDHRSQIFRVAMAAISLFAIATFIVKCLRSIKGSNKSHFKSGRRLAEAQGGQCGQAEEGATGGDLTQDQAQKKIILDGVMRLNDFTPGNAIHERTMQRLLEFKMDHWRGSVLAEAEAEIYKISTDYQLDAAEKAEAKKRRKFFLETKIKPVWDVANQVLVTSTADSIMVGAMTCESILKIDLQGLIAITGHMVERKPIDVDPTKDYAETLRTAVTANAEGLLPKHRLLLEVYDSIFPTLVDQYQKYYGEYRQVMESLEKIHKSDADILALEMDVIEPEYKNWVDLSAVIQGVAQL